jgi:hypothetical protein
MAVAMREPRTIDDLALSEEGARVRALVQEQLADGAPVPPVPPPPRPEWQEARRAHHQRIMDRAFSFPHRPGVPSRLRGTAPAYPEDAALWWGDENEAVPPFPWDAEPAFDGVVWGASVTCCPRAPMDPEVCFEAPDEAEDEPGEAPVPTDPPAVDVAAWLEGIGEPMTVDELAAMTGHTLTDVVTACRALRRAGLVARQPTNDAAVWVWRKAPR